VTLRKPPKPPHATTSLIGRMIGLVVLLALFAGVVWVATTNNQIPLVERSNLINPPGSHVDVRGMAMHLRTYGPVDGDTVVLVHDDTVAGGATLIRLAQELADGGHRVLVPDLVGFGFSPRPRNPGRLYTVTGQTEVVADLITGLGEEPGLVAGFGWGGAVAAELAATRPDIVTALALVNTAELPYGTDGWQTIEGLPLGVGRAVSYTRQGASDRAFRTFFEGCETGGWCNDEEVAEGFLRATTIPGTAESIRARRATGRASVAAGRLGEVAIPVVVVWSLSSSASEPQELASRFASAEVRTLLGVGERPELSTPARVAEAIIP
jgi:pimeloyl-ACP methyl ester carboxylesterase